MSHTSSDNTKPMHSKIDMTPYPLHPTQTEMEDWECLLDDEAMRQEFFGSLDVTPLEKPPSRGFGSADVIPCINDDHKDVQDLQMTDFVSPKIFDSSIQMIIPSTLQEDAASTTKNPTITTSGSPKKHHHKSSCSIISVDSLNPYNATADDVDDAAGDEMVVD